MLPRDPARRGRRRAAGRRRQRRCNPCHRATTRHRRVPAPRESGLRRQSEDLLRARARAGCRHRRDASPRLSVRAEADHGDGGDGGLGRVRRRHRFAHPRQHRSRRRHARIQVRRQPCADRSAESGRRREALRVPHRLPRLRAQGHRDLTAGGQLAGFHLRQPDADPGACLRDAHRRDLLPDEVFRGSERNQLRPLGDLRPRRALDEPAVSAVALGLGDRLAPTSDTRPATA